MSWNFWCLINMVFKFDLLTRLMSLSDFPLGNHKVDNFFCILYSSTDLPSDEPWALHYHFILYVSYLLSLFLAEKQIRWLLRKVLVTLLAILVVFWVFLTCLSVLWIPYSSFCSYFLSVGELFIVSSFF